MKCFSLLVFSLFSFQFLFGQSNAKIVSITPAKPTVSSTISITYNSAGKSAVLHDADSIKAECLIYRKDDTPLLVEVPLKKKGKSWSGKFKLTEKNPFMLAFQFASGDLLDYNNGNLWTNLVYGKKGKPVQGAHLALSKILKYGGYFNTETKNDSLAQIELNAELTLYPENTEALYLDLSSKISGEMKESDYFLAHEKVNSLYEKFSSDEEALKWIANLFLVLGDTEKVSEMRRNAEENNPGGVLLQALRINDLYEERDEMKRRDIAMEIIDEFPDMKSSRKHDLLSLVFSNSMRGQEYREAEKALEKMDPPEGAFFNQLAWACLERGVLTDQAVVWAKRGCDLLRHTDISMKPSFWSKQDWEQSTKENLAATLDTYGYGLIKQGKNEDAEPILKEAYQTMNGLDPEMNEHYLSVLLVNKKYDSVISTGLECVRKQKDNPALLENIKKAYIARDGSDKNFAEVALMKQKGMDETIAEAAKDHAKEIMKTVQHDRTAKPATDFTLLDLEGNAVSLSSLKGKVVVVDFWATWCNPCKMSFPFLQRVYDTYKGNENVKIFALNTWERIQETDKRLEAVKKFLQENHYTFPILVDDNVVSEYGVEGIPTKFIIDKKGNIAYTSVGFEGPKMVETMRQEIELLLKE